MVQEAGLDLIGPALAAGLSALALTCVPVVAAAQPLVPNTPLTTLLQPQRLDRSKPLMPQGNLVPSRQGVQPGQAGSPCERPAGIGGSIAGVTPGMGGNAGTGIGTGALAGAVPPAPRAASGGSGPGEYARFFPDAPQAGSASSGGPARTAKPSASTGPGIGARVGVDRPLYGGESRPLWDTGERRALAQPGAAKPSASDGGKPALSDSSTEAAAPDASGSALPEIPRDRPLWADGLTPAFGAAAAPCLPTRR